MTLLMTLNHSKQWKGIHLEMIPGDAKCIFLLSLGIWKIGHMHWKLVVEVSHKQIYHQPLKDFADSNPLGKREHLVGETELIGNDIPLARNVPCQNPFPKPPANNVPAGRRERNTHIYVPIQERPEGF